MRILVNGTCASRGEGSWPYFLSQFIDCSVINLSVAGSGNAYIHETTVNELAKRSYDIVLVMWGNSLHHGLPVNDITKFSNSKNTSLYQSSMNDWPGKTIYPENDQDYVDKNWILNAGYLDSVNDTVSNFFRFYHSHVTYDEILKSDIIRMISLQSVLKETKQPYLFLSVRPVKKHKRYDHLYKLVDWDNFFTADSLNEIAKRTNDRSEDNKSVPGPVGQAYYAGLIANQITKSLNTGMSGR